MLSDSPLLAPEGAELFLLFPPYPWRLRQTATFLWTAPGWSGSARMSPGQLGRRPAQLTRAGREHRDGRLAPPLPAPSSWTSYLSVLSSPPEDGCNPRVQPGHSGFRPGWSWPMNVPGPVTVMTRMVKTEIGPQFLGVAVYPNGLPKLWGSCPRRLASVTEGFQFPGPRWPCCKPAPRHLGNTAACGEAGHPGLREQGSPPPPPCQHLGPATSQCGDSPVHHRVLSSTPASTY